MSQIFDADGNAIPVTFVHVSPVVVTQIKTQEKDGYEAVQIGHGEKKEKNIKKPQKGHLKKTQNSKLKSQNVRRMREWRGSTADMKEGDLFDVSVFKEGDAVVVSGTSKGRGFQGVVKRHGFHGGPRSHGQKHSEREAGSIGATGPQRVFKGTRMAGRMGSDRVTVKRVRVIKIDKDNNVIALKGAVPGAYGSPVEITGHE